MHEAANVTHDAVDLAEVDEIVAAVGHEPRHLITMLQALQDRYDYLPEPALQRVCRITELSPAHVLSVASFYSQFRLEPAGRHTVKVCVGTACHVMGADAIVQALHEHLEIPEGGDTDPERVFTVSRVACLGCCMLAPAVQIDDVTYGFVKSNEVSGMLRDFLVSQQSTVEAEDAALAQEDVEGEVRICLCSSCVASGAREVQAEVLRQVKDLRLPARLKVVGCTGMAYRAPLVEIALADRPGIRYGRVRPEQVRRLLVEHFRPAGIGSRIRAGVTGWLERLLTDETWEPMTRYLVDTNEGADAAFAAPQRHLVTDLCGCLTPLDLDEYLDRGGFDAARECLESLTASEVVDRVEASGLRGRGGAGFPTAAKWKVVQAAEHDDKIIICNGDEGDPGAFMDRQILESFPYRVIEGMIIAAAAVGARRGFLYIRAEYPLAIERVRAALERCEERSFLGDDMLGSGRSLHLEVVAGAGAFVCGEETALIAAIEGRRGTPRLRPPYPAEHGLWGRPTLVNNVETCALLPGIVASAGNGFALLGTEASRGTKTFALAGKVARSGLVEVPMGMTLREIVSGVGGGVREGHTLKAVQVGGPSGGCVPEWLADTPVDYEALTAAGAMMGSGGMVVLDDSDCMVDIARYFMAFTQAESCGKCTFCRVGTKRMLEILERLCSGEGRRDDLDRLEELAHSVKLGSLCGLGKTAPNPVLSTLEHFRSEYEAHLEGRCPAGRCRALISYSITDDCIGCTRCAQYCTSGAIEMLPNEVHVIDSEVCCRCGNCKGVCPVDAVRVE